MQQLFAFFLEHWWLSGLFILLAGAYIMLESLQALPAVSNQELTRLVNSEEALLLDIRGSADFRAGHITGSRNLPYADLSEQMGSLHAYRDKPIIVICMRGQTAVAAGQLLRRDGFKRVYKLAHGIHGWTQDQLPLIS